MDQHPQYKMWHDRWESEQSVERARVDQRARRELERASWYEAWHSYKARRGYLGVHYPLPRWWNLIGWVRWLLRLHAPGRPN